MIDSGHFTTPIVFNEHFSDIKSGLVYGKEHFLEFLMKNRENIYFEDDWIHDERSRLIEKGYCDKTKNFLKKFCISDIGLEPQNKSVCTSEFFSDQGLNCEKVMAD